MDVVKSRVMGDKAGKYTGMANCFAKTFAEEGIFAFYRGFAPNFARLGSWNVVMFLSLEKARGAEHCGAASGGGDGHGLRCCLRWS